MWIDLLLVYLAFRVLIYLGRGLDWWTSRMGPRQIAAYRRDLESIQFPHGRAPSGAGEARRPPGARARLRHGRSTGCGIEVATQPQGPEHR
jgi:hypothetical protein